MFLSQHAVAGSAVAVATGNPILGFFAALASHQLLDDLPHIDGVIVKNQDNKYVYEKSSKWSENLFFLAYIDVIITALIIGTILVLTDNKLLVLSGAAGGVLTDFLDLVPWWKDRFRATWIGRRWHRIHQFGHYHLQETTGIGLISILTFQWLITIGGIWVLLLSY
ncbi:MAG: hypothetical protein Q7S37_04065 [bacterium]|nr:hypothetical protein [bacterium]